jgi:isopropylmalate/homocitrate/citramalate synthase
VNTANVQDTMQTANPEIVFFDTTLRDGEQSPGCTMHHAEKLRIAHQLAALGVDVMEAGFAIASQGDLESIRTIAREVRGPRIASLARCKREDIEAAAKAVEPAQSSRIHVFLATSDLHLQAKLKITRAEALDQAVAGVSLACRYCDDVEFSAEDATRSDPDFLVEIVKAAKLRTRIELFFQRIVMMIWGWRSRIRWPDWRAVRGRWSAPSMESGNARAMRRLKRLRRPWRRGETNFPTATTL